MDNASFNVEPGRQVLPMLPSDQVAAIIEQMRTEQARLLRDQQDAIVARVMRNLSEKGISQVDPKPISSRHSWSTAKLEQSLHSLVFHSLEESGLDYPHVQRGMVSVERPEHDRRSTRPTPKTDSHRTGKAVIVHRQETTDRQKPLTVGDCVTDDVPEEICTHEPTNNHDARHKPVPARISESPLGDPTRGRESRRRQAKAHRRRFVDTPDNRDSDFESVRSKVGYKTLAILDKSRALLDEMKQLPRGHHPPPDPIDNDKTFVYRMRQKLTKAETSHEATQVDHDDDPADPTIGLTHPPSSTNRTDDAGTDPPGAENSLVQPKSPDVATNLLNVPPDPTPAPSVSAADIEILKPPTHAPENEDEWENELARQILTIYATSVKAKQTANRPSSQAGRCERNPASSAAPHLRGEPPRLGTSCSLPAISRAKQPAIAMRERARNRSPPRQAVQYSWEPSQRLGDGRVVVNMPKVPKPIWFAGTGAVKAVWCAIAEGFQGLHASPAQPNSRPHGGSIGRDAVAVCEHQLCEEVRRLEAKQQYSQCVATLETLLVGLVRARGVNTLETKLWKQLVVTCNAFASRCVDYKKFVIALQLIKQAERLLHHSILVDDAMRFELLAYLYDTYAHYYYRRGKSHAGLQYMFKAHEIHGRQSNWTHIAKCRLHMANLLSMQSKHDEAMGYMASILELFEDKKLEDSNSADGASAQKVCLAAVCYNNMAIEQLYLRQFEAASVSTGNANRLAKLCLSYSNRWLAQFDATSNCVDLAIATLMEDVNASANAPYKA